MYNLEGWGCLESYHKQLKSCNLTCTRKKNEVVWMFQKKAIPNRQVSSPVNHMPMDRYTRRLVCSAIYPLRRKIRKHCMRFLIKVSGYFLHLLSRVIRAKYELTLKYFSIILQMKKIYWKITCRSVLCGLGVIYNLQESYE